ncbi:hypothetical protein [Xanthomonas phage XPP1]|uniref:Uncharacterized protein n=1 Tax=Xanthomonas phage XPP1 TaxID=2099853 RepID=A0A3S7HHL9_9CAUD|nr:hypothetical protein KEM11_gp36 [Xanthomonas phage XPP1]AVO23733.1 hypothetical protein [Xanthomonas phage XPP2]AVO23810.1 hypothetical protein [Xanthomonas phage XPP3]AVO23900.1 hypothetical protein [Xanthomonas phage XPP4]AVO24009.1 hypothetical protein [Xanthomonas phage XPP6]AVO24012.1 hypothetical protein [Xanthomonas phage XPP8]AVO24379.1 hypothetical protein [Xanthomonas phage XPV3]
MNTNTHTITDGVLTFASYTDKIAYYRAQQPDLYELFDELLPNGFDDDSDEARAAKEYK